MGIERIGTLVVTPGIDTAVLAEGFRQLEGTLFGLYDLFAGGAFGRAAVFGLGIMPYISASIIIQLLGSVIPFFQKLQKEGEEGRKKNYTIYPVWNPLYLSYAGIWSSNFLAEYSACKWISSRS